MGDAHFARIAHFAPISPISSIAAALEIDSNSCIMLGYVPFSVISDYRSYILILGVQVLYLRLR